jgi:hypothetical protein
MTGVKWYEALGLCCEAGCANPRRASISAAIISSVPFVEVTARAGKRHFGR